MDQNRGGINHPLERRARQRKRGPRERPPSGRLLLPRASCGAVRSEVGPDLAGDRILRRRGRVRRCRWHLWNGASQGCHAGRKFGSSYPVDPGSGPSWHPRLRTALNSHPDLPCRPLVRGNPVRSYYPALYRLNVPAWGNAMVDPPGTAPGSSETIHFTFIAIAGLPAFHHPVGRRTFSQYPSSATAHRGNVW